MSPVIVSFHVCTTTTFRNSLNAYTNVKFHDVQEELRRKIYCYPTLLHIYESL